MTLAGFVLTREWKDLADGQALVFWIASESGPVRVEMRQQESVFFVARSAFDQLDRQIRGLIHRSAALSLRSFGDEPVVACYFRSQKDLATARSRLRATGITAFEADIRPTDRFLMERFITGGVEVTSLDTTTRRSGRGFTAFTDPQLKPGDWTPELKVISLDIETSWRDRLLYSIAISGGTADKVFMRSDGHGQSATDTAESSRQNSQRDEHARVAGHIEFCEGETQLITHFLDWLQEEDPDVIIGWNVVGFDLWVLQERCDALDITFRLGRDGEAVHWRKAATGDRRFALVPGRGVLDGIELLRTATHRFESFSLEHVSRQLLGRGKLVEDVDTRATEIEEMFHNDKLLLARYNLEDCKLVEDIFATTDLIAFAIERSQLTGLDMDRQGGSVAAFDYLYLPRLHRAGRVAPVLNDENAVASPGGYVLDSTPGLYDNVLVLDFKSLYPSIIRTFHVDPLALLASKDEQDAIEGFKGGAFSRHQHILPGIIEQLWRARDEAKRLGQGAMSQAIKIIMNSFYGVLGTTGCRFFDPRLASSITMRGHEILQKTRDLIQARGYDVIYGDTDSVFVLLGPLDNQNEADFIGNELMRYLNQWWQDYLTDEMGLDSCLEVEYETHFDRFLMPTVRGSEIGSKKRYAGLIFADDGNAELVFKGLETVRSDWCQLAREFQQELYRRIFLEQSYEQYVIEVVEAVLSGQCDDKLILRRRLRRKLDDYRKSTPPHVRAARIAEDTRARLGLPGRYANGGWIEYVMTTSGPEPCPYVVSPIDYQFYVERQLTPVADAILSFQSNSLGAITDRQMGLF
jgi:DNA polymerase-2